ncbi:DUF2247 family protein [Exiguobacterium algae]|uniref:DUF2247 family protein n=1 Tax=Exiguobacterium algae TaxID=2751250 RepID=UPI001BE870BF
MNYLQLFNDNSIPITWTSILIGIEGPGKFNRLLEWEEIIQYAIGEVNKQQECSELVNEIAFSYSSEGDLIYRLVAKLSNSENIDREVELKKWIVIILSEKLKNTPQSPLYGMLYFTEFWEKFDYPEYSPHLVQGMGNEIKPEEYYSKGYYEKCALEHKQWILHELKKIQE